MISRAASALAVCLLIASAAQGSWLSDKTGINIDLNKQIGTGVGAVAQPTIDAAETAGHRIIEDADRRGGARLEQVDTMLSKQLSTADLVLEQRIGQVDRIAATRLKEIDAMADKDITRIDAVAAKRIADIDAILKNRTSDVDTLLQGNIADLDDRLGARLDQVDELTERRFGNLETLAMKSTTMLSSAVLRLIAFACLLIFAAAGLWRVYVESAGAWPAGGTLFSRLAAWWKKVHNRLGWQLGTGAACIIILFVVFTQVLPSGSSDQLEQTHLRELQRSLSSLDLTEAKYHASQLKVLDPTNPAYRGYALKIDLLRDVLSRPALYQTAAGLHQTLSRIEQAELQLVPQRDRDIETLKALIVFRTNPSRQSEHDAAMLCAAALAQAEPDRADASFWRRSSKTEPTPSDGGFALQALALNYVENYLTHPLASPEAYSAADAPKEVAASALGEIVARYDSARATRGRALTPLSHVLAYDALVRDLSAKSVAAYRRMIDAQADLATADAGRRAQLIAARTAAAREVIAAWQEFDDALADRHSIDQTSAAYAVFTLNDAVVTRARAYAQSSVAVIPPVLSERSYPSAVARARMLPPRVIWAKRYLSSAGATNQVVAIQEAERFRQNEKDAYDFEDKFVKYTTAKNTSHQNGYSALVTTGSDAALAAARLGLAYGANDLAATIMNEVGALLTPEAALDLKFEEHRKSVAAATRDSAVSFL